ncbi:uncharacterized protein LOC141587925 [Silene latifolia]|uniref:uncharacterized protein LOC141587925 n=1 Tax=Silene latifolia TaxID=37657 RepID=UPI003D78A21C
MSSVPYVEDAMTLWKELEERFAVVDGMSIHSLKTELRNCKQLKGASRTPAEWKALREAKKNERRKLFCTHCIVNGYEISACFIKQNKFPNWWGSRSRTLAELYRKRGVGSATGAAGGGATIRANVVLARNEQKNTGASVSTHSVSSTDKLSGISSPWIIDTGASYHVTCDLRCFVEKISIPARPVGLPNGQQVMASLMGTVHVNNAIILRRVLFVSSLTYSLISVSQLTLDNDYTLQFAKDSCYIQDHSSRTMIVVGEMRDGLYFLRSDDNLSVHTVGMVGSADLWHRRLEHPPEKVVQFIPSVRTFNSNKSKTRSHFLLLRAEDTIPSLDPSSLIFNDESPHPLSGFGGGGGVSDGLSSPNSSPTPHSETVGPTETVTTADPDQVTEPTETFEPITSTDPATTELGRGQRIKFPNSRLRGYVLGMTQSPSQYNSSSPPSSPSGNPYSLANYVNCDKFPSCHKTFLAAITTGVEPTSFKVAVQDDNWCQAMQNEIRALENNDTWELTMLPPDKKALGCRWVYKIKYKSDGSIERYKARFVVFGNHQVEGLDYGETFPPVVKMVTIRTFLDVVAVKKWELHQMDVHNAFLHGDLAEEVYAKLPPGFHNEKVSQVCRLKKSFYGLCQSPRCWFGKLTGALREYGFRQSYSDYSLFSYSADKVRLHVLVYVDDLVIAVSWKTKKQHTVSLSSAEAEYRSIAAIICELKWLKGLLTSLDVPISCSMQLFCDNQSAIHLAQNPVFHERTKHIEVDCHFVCDAISEGLVAPTHVSTTEQLADIFTKALGVQQFHYLLRKLGILDLHAPT